MIMSSRGAETSRGVGAEGNRELTPTNSEDVSDCKIDFCDICMA